MEFYVAQPRYRQEELGLPSTDQTDFVGSPWKASTFLRSGWGKVGRRLGAGAAGR